MADSGGHWKTLAEAQKLTQSTKIPGVIENDIKRNNPLERVPVAQAAGTGLKIEWLREKTTTDDAVTEAAVGQQLVWGDDVEYTEVESTLRYIYLQRKLDRYVQGIYGTYNDYKAQVLLEMEKGLKRVVGDRFIYGDTTYGGTPTQFDGLHALAAENSTPNSATLIAAAATDYSNLNFDAETLGLSITSLRQIIDAMLFGCDEIWVPWNIGIRLDAAYEEMGMVRLASATAGSMATFSKGISDIGKPILYFAGIPVLRTDYLMKEQEGTGTGATANRRGKYASGTITYSVFGVRYGNVMERDPGLCYAFGGTSNAGDLYELVLWENLEDYNAGGMRMNSYGTVLLGSPKCVARIADVTDVAVIA